MNEAARNFDAPPHTSGKISHWLVFPFGQFDRLEQVRHQAPATVTWNAVELGVNQKIFFDTQFEIAGHRLWNDPDQASNVTRLLDDIKAVNLRAAGCSGNQCRQHPDQ